MTEAKKDKKTIEALRQKKEKIKQENEPLRCDSCGDLLLLSDFKCRCGHPYISSFKEKNK